MRTSTTFDHHSGHVTETSSIPSHVVDPLHCVQGKPSLVSISAQRLQPPEVQQRDGTVLAQILAQPTNPKVCPWANRVRRARLTLWGLSVSVWIGVQLRRRCLPFRQVTLKHIVQGNGRRNGLKIAVLAISELRAAGQIQCDLPAQIAQIDQQVASASGARHRFADSIKQKSTFILLLQ
jgi:hypothetical protein